MNETAQKNIVLDVELIALLALVVGLLVYGLGRRIFKKELPQNEPFEWIDLVLMFLPAAFFLMMPFLNAFVPEEMLEAAKNSADKSEAEKRVGDITTSLVNIGFFLFVAMVVFAILEWIRNIRVVEVFGLKRLSLPKVVIISVLGGLATVLLCASLLGNVTQEYLNGIFSDLKEQAPVEDFKNSASSISLWMKVAAACIAAPLAEEMLFRGYIYGTVKRFTSPIFSMVITGGLFAAAHANLSALAPLWALAILLCLSYEITKCLWVPIGIHAVFNIAANIAFMLVQRDPNATL